MSQAITENEVLQWLKDVGCLSLAEVKERLDALEAENERLNQSLTKSDEALAAQVGKCCAYIEKLDAVALALGLPVEAHHIAGCDVLAHYVRDTVANSRMAFAECERLRAELATARNDALEKAAKVCKRKAAALAENPENAYVEPDTNALIWTNSDAEWAAAELEEARDAIRALKDKPL